MFLILSMPRPPTTTLFPYTTLFRSLRQVRGRTTDYPDIMEAVKEAVAGGADLITVHLREDRRHITEEEIGRATSELQSHHDLVCRLLLEKKKIILTK